jgi:hypothetical protein
MIVSKFQTISTHRRPVVGRLVIMLPLLITLLAACSPGSGGGPAY